MVVQHHTAETSIPLPRAGYWESALYNAFVHTAKLGTKRHTARLWQWLWKRSCAYFRGPITTLVHGHSVVTNYGYTYPINTRMYRSYNAPLLELTYQVQQISDYPITIVDVGAAIGDTVLLLQSNLGERVGRYYCIEGDQEFFRYLQHNLRHLPNVTLSHQLLAAEGKAIPKLVRHHAGSATATGVASAAAVSLDSLLANVENIDLLKIDVDGFDGQVLRGSTHTLQCHHPAIVFEWHPLLLRRTGNNVLEHFETLDKSGYDRFVWYTKFGEFSHIAFGYNERAIAALAQYCLETSTRDDWHYDVIALHSTSALDPVALAHLGSAGRRASRN